MVGGDIDGVELGGAVEGGDLSGSHSVGVAVDVAAEKGEHAFPGQMQIQLLIVRADDGGLLRIELQKRYLAGDDAHGVAS